MVMPGGTDETQVGLALIAESGGQAELTDMQALEEYVMIGYE
jgi:hypothetical protein